MNKSDDCIKTCEYVKKWTYKEIIPLCGTVGVAFVLLVMMYLRLADLYHHEKEDWEIDRQRENEVITKLEIIEARIIEQLDD